MQRIKTDSTIRIEYQEIKKLELMDQPWHGSGYMYSKPPDMMVREQLEPKRIIMGVKAEKLYYFDSENNIRHSGEMDDENPMSLNIAVFLALMNADEALLHHLYQVEFSANAKRWTMHLKPKLIHESDLNIVISGLPDKQADLIRIEQADGDVNEFLLKESTTGKAIDKKINQLYLEVQGE